MVAKYWLYKNIISIITLLSRTYKLSYAGGFWFCNQSSFSWWTSLAGSFMIFKELRKILKDISDTSSALMCLWCCCYMFRKSMEAHGNQSLLCWRGLYKKTSKVREIHQTNGEEQLLYQSCSKLTLRSKWKYIFYNNDLSHSLTGE